MLLMLATIAEMRNCDNNRSPGELALSPSKLTLYFRDGRIRLFVAYFLLLGALHCVRTTGQPNEDQNGAATSSGELDAAHERVDCLHAKCKSGRR